MIAGENRVLSSTAFEAPAAAPLQGARARISRSLLRTSYGAGAVGIVGALFLSPLVGLGAIAVILALEWEQRRFRRRR